MFICWGELLWDHFATGPRLGGAAANVAVNLLRLGARPLLVSLVGADAAGGVAIAQLAELGLDTKFIQVDPNSPTGSVEIQLHDGEPRYSMNAQAAWDRLTLDVGQVPAPAAIDAIVYAALAQRTKLVGGALSQLLRARSKTCWSVCDLNLRLPFVDAASIHETLVHADAIKINESEAATLSRLLAIADPVAHLFANYDVSVIAITRQQRGCTLFDRQRRVDHPGFPKLGRGDSVGAGDAFCAALAWYLVQGMDLEQVASRANDHARRVASADGALGFAVL